jgi:hypothetical protein
MPDDPVTHLTVMAYREPKRLRERLETTGRLPMSRCREAARAVAGEGLEGGGRLRALEMRLHLLLCRHCRRYARQVRALGGLARRLCLSAEPDEERLRELEARILRALDEEDSRTAG